ncbi:MAG: HAMP domain-containing histidine kinase [Gemmatimonadetes bacterium]|nr:HAMP domain-containing histidine kinase [Gemmatimonadota bacterium]
MAERPIRSWRLSTIALGVAVACLAGGFLAMARSRPEGAGRAALALLAAGATLSFAIAFGLERRQARRSAERSRELEHLSAELIHANRSKSEFLASVSHELRTPLNAIVGFAELLREGAYGPLGARQAGPVERIESSATHLRRLVDQILDLARIAAGRMELHREPLDLRPFVISLATEMEPLAAERGLALSLNVGATLPRVHTDPAHLRQILVNLIGNAIKFTASGTIAVRARQGAPPADVQAGILVAPGATGTGAHRIAELVAAAPAGEWIAVQVVDTGAGIAPADQARVFDEFEQVTPPGGPPGSGEGTGLGLSISRRLARLLGGELTVESEVGRGSAFTLWLPVGAPDGPAPAERPAPNTF